jgi:hypothetical protein
MNVNNPPIQHAYFIENHQEPQESSDFTKIYSNNLSKLLKEVCNNIYALKEAEIKKESLNKSNEMAKAFEEEKKILKEEVIDESIKIGERFKNEPEILSKKLSALGEDYGQRLNQLNSNRTKYDALLAEITKKNLLALADQLKKSYADPAIAKRLNDTASREAATILDGVADLHL